METGAVRSAKSRKGGNALGAASIRKTIALRNAGTGYFLTLAKTRPCVTTATSLIKTGATSFARLKLATNVRDLPQNADRYAGMEEE